MPTLQAMDVALELVHTLHEADTVNYAEDTHTGSTISGDGTTDYERVDKLFADRSRRSTNEVFESGMRITDFGHFKKRRTGPTTFEFNVLGELIHYKPWWKARWLLRGTGIHIRS